MHKSIKVGLFDWTNFSSNNSFYPDDLPVDWKLSFYANEFETACISVDQNLDFSLLSEWLDDLPDNFELSFYVQKTELLERLSETLLEVGEKVNYLIVQQPHPDFLLQNESVKSVIYKNKNGLSLSQRLLELASIWTPDNVVKSSCVALLADTDDKRLYRRWIELWLADNGQQNLTLWLDAKTARYSSVSELRTLVELMGY